MDTRSYHGTVTIGHPLTEPLYDGKTPHELLAVFSEQYDRKPYEIVRQYWQTTGGRGSQQGQATIVSGTKTASSQPSQSNQQPTPRTADFETWWRQSVHDGFLPNTALPVKTHRELIEIGRAHV